MIIKENRQNFVTTGGFKEDNLDSGLMLDTHSLTAHSMVSMFKALESRAASTSTRRWSAVSTG